MDARGECPCVDEMSGGPIDFNRFKALAAHLTGLHLYGFGVIAGVSGIVAVGNGVAVTGICGAGNVAEVGGCAPCGAGVGRSAARSPTARRTPRIACVQRHNAYDAIAGVLRDWGFDTHSRVVTR